MDKSIQIDTLSRFIQVSRETITSLKKYEDLLIKANKSLNLVGNSTINQIWSRHFLDSAQVIDFVDKNDKCLVDLGSGAGFPRKTKIFFQFSALLCISCRIIFSGLKALATKTSSNNFFGSSKIF